MNIDDSHNFVIWKSFPDLISVDQCTESEGIFFILFSAISDIDDYTKLCKLT